MRELSKFELHYYLNGTSHSMDALLHNKCEAEFLALAYEVIEELGFNVSIETEALYQGGIRDFFECVINDIKLAEKIPTLTLIALVLQVVFSRFPVETDLQRTIQEQTIEKNNLEIQKLRHELAQISEEKELLSKPEIKNSLAPVLHKVEQNRKVVTRRSNFYKNLLHYPKIEGVSFSGIDTKGQPVFPEMIVEKKYFDRFIVRSNKLKVEVIENAEIIIVSPVLEKNRSKWKGIYDGQVISFDMLDKDFKNDILTQKISFTNGEKMICVLSIHREINELGEIEIRRYTVDVVLEKMTRGQLTATISGQRYLYNQEQEKNQGRLFD